MISLLSDTPAAPAITERVEDVAELPRRPPAVSVDDKVEKLTGIRKAMVKSMRDALNIPHFGYCDEISVDSLIRSVPSFLNFEIQVPFFSMRKVNINMDVIKWRERPYFLHTYC